MSAKVAAAVVQRDLLLDAAEQVERAQRELMAIMALMAAAGQQSRLPADVAYPLLVGVSLHLDVVRDQLTAAGA